MASGSMARSFGLLLFFILLQSVVSVDGGIEMGGVLNFNRNEQQIIYSLKIRTRRFADS